MNFSAIPWIEEYTGAEKGNQMMFQGVCIYMELSQGCMHIAFVYVWGLCMYIVLKLDLESTGFVSCVTNRD